MQKIGIIKTVQALKTSDSNKPLHRMAVIVPYRDRQWQLEVFARHLTYFLKNNLSNTKFDIIIIEQADDQPFNRGKLLNTGFYIAGKESQYDYYCFHDVDLLPEEVDYNYPNEPVHLAWYLEHKNYQVSYQDYYGGVNLFLTEHFELINGYSNRYWGWGAEDDDLRLRLEYKGFKPLRRKGRFYSLPHKQADKYSLISILNKKRYREFQKKKYDFQNDGLSDLKYELCKKVVNEYYTIYNVKI